MLSTFKAAWAENRRVLNNFFSLSLVQFANYLAPLITLPYLFRVLGPSKYGLVELARAVSVYFLMVTDYGFSLSATREISIHRDDVDRVSEVFSAVLLLKFMLVVLSAAVLAMVVVAVPKLRADWPVYFLAFGNVIGMWLFPIWLFQGLERMKPIATLNVTAKLLVIASIFLFVREQADYIYVPLLQSAGTILIGAGGLLLALRSFHVRLRLLPVAVLKREFKDGRYLFASKMATTLYTTTNIVILGLFADFSFVGYYAAGDKIVRAVQGLQVPLSQAIFPHIGKLASESKEAALAFAARIAGLVSAVTLALSVALFVTAPYLSQVIFEQQSGAGVSVIRILSFLPFIIGLTDILGVQVMINFRLEKALTKILMTAGILNIAVALLLVMPLRHIGVAIAAVLTEVFITLAIFIALRQRGVHVFGALGRDVHNPEAVSEG